MTRRITVRVPARGDRYTDEAVAGLIGQEPRWLHPIHTQDPRNVVARARVAAATTDPDNGDLLLTLDLPHVRHPDVVDELLTDAKTIAVETGQRLVEDDGRVLFSMGYMVAPSGATHVADLRVVSDMRVLDVGVMPPDPSDPAQAPLS